MLSIATNVVPGELAAKLKAIAGIGFDAIDLSLTDVAQFDGSPKDLAVLVANTGLTIASLGPIAAGASPSMIATNAATAKALGADLLILAVDSDLPNDLPARDGVRVALRPPRRAEDAAIAFVNDQNDTTIGLALNAFDVLGDGLQDGGCLLRDAVEFLSSQRACAQCLAQLQQRTRGFGGGRASQCSSGVEAFEDCAHLVER